MNTATQDNAVLTAIDVAIAESAAETRTVELADSADARHFLSLDSDGDDDNGTYWGTTEDGAEWEVRLIAE